MSKTALVLITIQNDHLPRGATECDGDNLAGENAGKLLAWARDKDILPVHIQQISKKRGAAANKSGTIGSHLHSSMTPLPGEIVLEKHHPDSFRETGLELVLRENGIEQIIIAGMMSHMCIGATKQAAEDLGFTCVLVQDACAALDLVFNGVTVHTTFVQIPFMCALAGLYARVCSTDEIISGNAILG